MSGRVCTVTNSGLEVRDADEFPAGDHWVMSRVDAIALRDRLSAWFAETAAGLGNGDPCECMWIHPVLSNVDGDDRVLCELCGGELDEDGPA